MFITLLPIIGGIGELCWCSERIKQAGSAERELNKTRILLYQQCNIVDFRVVGMDGKYTSGKINSPPARLILFPQSSV